MKRAIAAIALFFVAQIVCSAASMLYMMWMGYDIHTDTAHLARAAGTALLFGNTVIITIMTLWKQRGKLQFHPKGINHQRTNILLSIAALLLLAWAETLLLSPLGIEDAATEQLFSEMLHSPWCLINLAFVGPMAEELIFRYGVLDGLRRSGFRPFSAIALSAIAFSVVHGNLLQIPPALISGTALGFIYVRSHSLWPCIVAHVANNMMAIFTLAHPEAEDALLSLPLWIVIGAGTLLLAASFLLVFRISPSRHHEDRTD